MLQIPVIIHKVDTSYTKNNSFVRMRFKIYNVNLYGPYLM